MTEAPGDRPVILVVEDDPDIRTLVRCGLEAAGFNVIVAVDGLDGLRKATSANPAVIVLDIAMPNLSGTSVLKILRTKGPDAPSVIFLTASARLSDRTQGLELGAVEYFTKPFVLADLVKSVRSALLAREGRIAKAHDEAERRLPGTSAR